MTKIEWTNETWNFVTGCDKVSQGCKNCYAEVMANRLKGRHGYPTDNPFKLTVHRDKLALPLKWKRPRLIFVNSMSDFFHKDIPQDILFDAFATMMACPQHTFQILTKRPERIRPALFGDPPAGADMRFFEAFRNVWLGTSCEDQKTFDLRKPYLEDLKVTTFLSLEPLLGPIEVGDLSGIDWVIVGGESGSRARPMHPEWPRAIRDRCLEARVPFFFKQWGAWAWRESLDQWTGKKRGPIEEGGGFPEFVGKNKSGRVLDGLEWAGMPERVQP